MVEAGADLASLALDDIVEATELEQAQQRALPSFADVDIPPAPTAAEQQRALEPAPVDDQEAEA